MDYVYICRSGDNDELRYSLRSIEENMPKGRVWVVGHRPIWYIGDFIPVDDIGGKFDNIVNCIKTVSENNDISDNFILMNDDFFALNPIDKLKNYHGGLLENKIARYKELRMAPKYIRLLELTLRQLKENGINSPMDYDIHVPIIMNKAILKDAINLAFFPRSAYGNLAKLEAIKITDVKIYSNGEKINWHEIINNDFVSTEDNSFISLKNNILNKMFDKPSQLENPNY
jgi:hypothetical protein